MVAQQAASKLTAPAGARVNGFLRPESQISISGVGWGDGSIRFGVGLVGPSDGSPAVVVDQRWSALYCWLDERCIPAARVTGMGRFAILTPPFWIGVGHDVKF